MPYRQGAVNGKFVVFNDGAALLGATSPVLAALRTRTDIGVLRHKKSRTAVQNELPPVSWTSKLKSREWEAFHVCGFAVEA